MWYNVQEYILYTTLSTVHCTVHVQYEGLITTCLYKVYLYIKLLAFLYILFHSTSDEYGSLKYISCAAFFCLCSTAQKRVTLSCLEPLYRALSIDGFRWGVSMGKGPRMRLERSGTTDMSALKDYFIDGEAQHSHYYEIYLYLCVCMCF